MENTKKERIFFLDVLKFIALILMAILHIYSTFEGILLFSSEWDYSNLEVSMNIIYLIVPTVFMLVMGASINLSRNKDAKRIIKRGLNILILSLILNIIRGIIIYFVYIYYGDELSISNFLYTVVDWLLGNDVLMFAGLFFIIYGLLSYLKKNKDIALAILAISLYIVSLFIRTDIEIEESIINSLVGNFIYVYDSYFPLITWLIIPTIGYFLSLGFKKFGNKDRYMFIVGGTGLVIFLTTFIVLKSTNNYLERYLFWGERDFLFDLPTLVLTISLDLVYITIIYLLSKPLSKVKLINNVISYESKNLTKIYFVHWILVMLLGLIVCLSDGVIDNGFIVIFTGVLVFITSSLIIILFNKIKNN